MSNGLFIGDMARIEAIPFDGNLKACFVSIVYNHQEEVYKNSSQTKEWKYLPAESLFGIVGLVIEIRQHKKTKKLAVRLLIGEERWWAEWETVYPIHDYQNTII